jgi:hypothetical protein
MTVGQRFVLTIAIVLVILLALAAYGYFTGGWENDENNAHVYGLASAQSQPAQAQPVYVVTKFEPRLLELEREAVEEAFKQKITSLWIVWMSDERGQPTRAINGATQARKAFIASMQQLERREEEYKQSGK